MEILKSMFMLLSSTECSLPLFQVLLLLIFSTFALLFYRIKLALIINFLFTLFWGHLFTKEILSFNIAGKISGEAQLLISYAYLWFGLILIILLMVKFSLAQ